ncbi:MAG: hypothetical protein DRP10_02395 [Candidatus Aenigmatarchaeota archaeon]|nr:MAG: hypothetical protein DRP10_02395 [Candidatus Aenigmarchaeota archaeon]
MKLVVDSNVLFSFFKKESSTRKIITLVELLELYTLKSRIDELIKHKEEICSKSKITEEEFFKSLTELEIFVRIIDDKLVFKFGREAIKLAPHSEDAPLFALSLFFNCPIWSNEVAFKRQSKVKVFNTKELLELLGFS